ncbi:MAG: PQQ-binding-like beta-propeller repeat protein [Phycisphaeraceae bacterium]
MCYRRWLCVAWLLAVSPAYAAPAAWDFVTPEDAAPTITWEADWDATLEQNLARWNATLAERPEPERTRRRATLEAALLEAMIERFPDTESRHDKARRQIAELHFTLDPDGDAGFTALADLHADEAAGSEAAVDLLATMLEHAADHPHRERWVLHVAEQVRALREAEALASNHRLVQRTASALESLHRARRQWFDADEAHVSLGAWDHLEAETVALQRMLRRASLAISAGHHAVAVRPLEQLLATAEPGDSRHNEATWRLKSARGAASDNTGMAVSRLGKHATYLALDQMLDADALPDAGEIQWLYNALAEDAYLHERETGVFVTAADALDARVRAADAVETVAAEQARQLDEALTEAGGIDALTEEQRHRLYRQFRWAPSTHELMLRDAEQALRRRAYGEVRSWARVLLEHADDHDVRERAQALLERTRRTTVDQTVPESAEPGEWTVRRLDLPGAPRWPLGFAHNLSSADVMRQLPPLTADLVRGEGAIVAASPGLLACYDEQTLALRWSRRLPLVAGHIDGHNLLTRLVAPAPMSPAIADGRVYTRWGLEAAGAWLTDVMALDLATGELVWSTSDDPAWEALTPLAPPVDADRHNAQRNRYLWDELWPVSAPVAHEGAVYILALKHGRSFTDFHAPLVLVCLEAATGRLRWRQPFFAHGLQHGADWLQSLTRHGNALTIHDDAVYASTSLSVVARFDLHNGHVRWVRTYPRVSAEWRVREHETWREALRRQGMPPQVVGDHVLVAPRPMLGVLAVERASGELAWHEPFLPSDTLVGRLDDTVLLRDRRWLVAVAAATGAVRWRHRLGTSHSLSAHATRHGDRQPLVQQAGRRVVAWTGTAFDVLDAVEGNMLGRIEMNEQASPRTMVVAGDRIVVTDDAPTPNATATTDAPPPPEPAPVDTARTPALPLKRAQVRDLSRPMFWLSPEEQASGRIALAWSEGILNAFHATADLPLQWRKPLAGPVKDVLWHEDRIVLIAGHTVIALDRDSGVQRWRYMLDDPPTRWWQRDDMLLLGHSASNRPNRLSELRLLTLADGELRWHRHLDRAVPDYVVADVAWTAEALHVRGPGADDAHLGHQLDPQSGRIVARHAEQWAGETPPGALASNDEGCFALDDQRRLWRIPVDGSERATPFTQPPDTGDASGDEVIHLHGRWVQVAAADRDDATTWIYDRRDPAYLFERPRAGLIRDDRLYEFADGKLYIFDLPTAMEVAVCELPSVHRMSLNPIAAWEHDGTVLVAYVYLRTHRTSEVHIAAFDGASGEKLNEQVLAGLRYWRRDHDRQWDGGMAMHWAGDVLLAADLHGLVSFTPTSNPDEVDPPHWQVPYRPTPLPPGGGLALWEDGPALVIPLDDDGANRGPADAVLRLAHDGDRLYLAVTVPQAEASPARGRAHLGGGDWLELGLLACEATHRLAFMPHADGSLRQADLMLRGEYPRNHHRRVISVHEMPTFPITQTFIDNLVATADHQPATGTLVYALAIPLEKTTTVSADAWRQMSLALTLWSESPGADNPVRRARWGRGLAGRELDDPGFHTLHLVEPETNDEP